MLILPLAKGGGGGGGGGEGQLRPDQFYRYQASVST